MIWGSIRGIYASNFLSFLGLYPFVIDEQSSRLLVFAAIRRCELDLEVGHLVNLVAKETGGRERISELK